MPGGKLFIGGPLTGKTRRLVQAGLDHRPARTLCLTFYDANAAYLRQILEAETGTSRWTIATLQRFIFAWLHEHATAVGLPEDAVAVSAVVRSLAIRQAWTEVKGGLWKRYRNTPGAIEEMTRIFNWISAHRTQWRVVKGELSDHEIAKAYARYVALCDRHRLLTFQEAVLRAIDLASRDDMADRLRRRFPVILVDDLHHARPDQLAWLERLIGPESAFVGTAWLHPHHHDPALRHTWERIQTWGDIEILDAPAPGVNPAIHASVSRLDRFNAATRGQASRVPATTGGYPPIEIVTGETAEDETQAVAGRIARMLAEEPMLKPDDVAVVCADTGLIRFMQRAIARAGVPFAESSPPLRQNPLVRAALLIARWHARGPSFETTRALLRLPVFDLDPLDRATLEQAAARRGILPLNLTPSEDIRLRRPETWTAVTILKQSLDTVNRKQPLTGRIQETLDRWGATAWLQSPANPFPSERRDRWRAAFDAWFEHVRMLERAVDALGIRPRETAGLIERTLDHVPPPDAGEGVRFVDPQDAEGVRARVACVIGLSETAVPKPDPPFQLVEEKRLPGLFADGRPVTLPALRDHDAWIERETRRLAILLSRGSDRLCLSVSRHSPAGEAQLPSPLFETLLGDGGEIDRDGAISVRASSFWHHVPAPRATLTRPAEVPEHPPAHRTSNDRQPARVLQAPIFSASQIRTYLRCPLQFFYDRVLNLDSDETPGAFRRGSLLHEVLCVALGDGRTRSVDLRDRPPAAWLDDAGLLSRRALTALEAAWTGRPADLPEGGHYAPEQAWEPLFGPALQREAVKHWAERILRQWAVFETERRRDGPSGRPILLEMPFRIEIDAYRMIGRIDRIDAVRTEAGEVYDVIDYKTGSVGAASLAAQVKKFLPEGEDPPEDYQLPLYAIALQNGVEGIRATPRTLTYINLEKLEKTTRDRFKAEAARVIHLVDDGRLDPKQGYVPASTLTRDILDAIHRTLDAMASTPYPATPGYYCNMCGFRAACSRGRSYAGGEG